MASATTQGILDLGIAGLVAKPKDFQTGCSWKFEISWLTSLIFQEKFLRRWRIRRSRQPAWRRGSRVSRVGRARQLYKEQMHLIPGYGREEDPCPT